MKNLKFKTFKTSNNILRRTAGRKNPALIFYIHNNRRTNANIALIFYIHYNRRTNANIALIFYIHHNRRINANYTKSLGDRYDGIQRLFIQADSKQLYPSTISFWLTKTLKELGLEHVNVHRLMHTNINLQIAAGVPLKTVSARAGHSSTKVTAEVHAHMIQSSDRAVADKMGEILG